MSNQQYRQERYHEGDRSQRGRGEWRDDDRDWHGSRSRGQYQDRDDYRSREEQGRGGQQDWNQGNYGQGGYRQDDYGRDDFQRVDNGQGGDGRDDYGFYQGARRDQGGYQRGNYGQGGDYDRGQSRYGSNQDGGYQQSGHQGGSSWGQGGGMQRGNDVGQSHRGRGPKNYQRSDDRICEDVCDRLSDDHDVDASDIDVSVSNREVTLSGEVDSKQVKRHAEDCADSCSGVEHVQNNLRVKKTQSGRDDDGSNKSKSK